MWHGNWLLCSNEISLRPLTLEDRGANKTAETVGGFCGLRKGRKTQLILRAYIDIYHYISVYMHLYQFIFMYIYILNTCIYTYIYIDLCTYIHIYIYITSYIYIMIRAVLRYRPFVSAMFDGSLDQQKAMNKKTGATFKVGPARRSLSME